jgi:muconolactone delta-isomerase
MLLCGDEVRVSGEVVLDMEEAEVLRLREGESAVRRRRREEEVEKRLWRGDIFIVGGWRLEKVVVG